MVQVLENGDDWVYFNKGNANVLYRYTGGSPHLKGRLLRLRLSTQEYTTQEVYESIEKNIRPLLDDVLPIELVEIKFHKKEALNEGYGLLLPNILPEGAQMIKRDRYFTVFQKEDTFVVEMKPKWLFRNEYGCRNCANHRYKYMEEPQFCLRSLLDGDQREKVIQLISEDPNVQVALREYFGKDSNVFQKLLKLQDPSVKLETLNSISEVTPHIWQQMTLRDISVFLTIQSSIVSTVQIVDVDPKSPSKWEKWKTTEQKLISGNFYNQL